MSNKIEFKTFFNIDNDEDLEKMLQELKKRLLLDLELKQSDKPDEDSDFEWHSHLHVNVLVAEIQESREKK